MTHSLLLAPGRARRSAAAALAALVLLLGACGGGGGGGGGSDTAAPITPPPTGDDQPYNDPLAYSSARDGSLPGAEEAAAVTRRSISLGGRAVAYTTRTGHLIARHPVSAAAQASMFYVAYLADGAAAATRPVTFFFNGGPGSASVWLHLGSYGPRRLATGVPSVALPRPFAMVDNADSLLDTSDLVFVDAIGTGLSTAIAPFRNGDFWSVDADAALMRDFIVRWVAVNGRAASPTFVFGESYGGPRAALLAHLLPAAGVRLDGVILQSPAMDYNSNCAITGLSSLSCAPYLPSYAAVGGYLGLASGVPATLPALIDDARDFTTRIYAPALQGVIGGQPVPAELPPLLAARTGLAAANWQAVFNLGPGTFMRRLLPGQLLGRYDGRIVAALGTPLAAENDPSSTLITASFAGAVASELRETLRYGTASTYVLLSGAIETWNFTHAGRELPDTVPDLQLALQRNPTLRVLAINGAHDLATPFHQTEIDLARLNAAGRVQVRNHAGGHMSYLDDGSRAAQKADLVAFFRGVPAGQAPLAPSMARVAAPAVDRAGFPVARQVLDEAAVQRPLLDPWVPPAARRR